MIEIKPIEQNIIEIRINNKVTKADIEKLDGYFDEHLSDQAKVKLLLTMENWEGLTLKALLEDFKLLKRVNDISKAAVVADSTFLKIDTKLEGLYPGLDAAYFKADEKEVALNWLQN